ncbi:hypothetical protein LCGC14_2941380 [marine sediment metagenome]|uniref:Uncharacterized protein n=1 Tax=marine sediment metagenome TaxID=412755 RepID=A0A0F8Y4X2_9ZZZZ
MPLSKEKLEQIIGEYLTEDGGCEFTCINQENKVRDMVDRLSDRILEELKQGNESS